MLDNLKAFFANPYKSGDMDALDWFLLTGLLLGCIILWRFILIHITEAVIK